MRHKTGRLRYTRRRGERPLILRLLSVLRWPALLVLLLVWPCCFGACCPVPGSYPRLERPTRRPTPQYTVILTGTTSGTVIATIHPAEAWVDERLAIDEENEALHAAPWWEE